MIKNVWVTSLAGVARPSHTGSVVPELKGCGFDSWSGHTPGWQV